VEATAERTGRRRDRDVVAVRQRELGADRGHKLPAVEAFESFVAIALEAEGLVVSSGVKFPVRLPTRRKEYEEIQQHGYEVDLVGANAERLVLATVKSYLGSRGVVTAHVTGETKNEAARKRYTLLNRNEVRKKVAKEAAKLYGYRMSQVELRLYVGRFAAPSTGVHEKAIRRWARTQRVGSGPIKVFGLDDVVGQVREAASHKQYRDNPVLVTMKVLEAAGMLTETLPDDVGAGVGS